LNKHTLQYAIDILEAAKQENTPVRRHYYNSENEKIVISANKEGLVLYAVSFLKAAQKDYNGFLVDEDFEDEIIYADAPGFSAMEVQLEEDPDGLAYKKSIVAEKSWFRRVLLKMGWLLILVFIVLSLITGIITVFRWIF
jgi:hypothetical protein